MFADLSKPAVPDFSGLIKMKTSSFDWDRIKEDHEAAHARGWIAADVPLGTYSIDEMENISFDTDMSTVEVETAFRLDFQSMPPEAQHKMLELLEKADPHNMDFWRKILLK